MDSAVLFYLALYNSKRHRRSFLNRLVIEHSRLLESKDIEEHVSQADWSNALRQHAMLEAMGIDFVAGHQLAAWHGPSRATPLGLFCRGNPVALRRRSVAIVGARKAKKSLGWVRDLAAYLSLRGECIVSGGASGVDAAAHQGALSGRGLTVAYLGVPADRFYPARNRNLFGEILERGGAIASEHPPGAQTLAFEHAQRNRLIAMQAKTVVVAEAGIKSGTLGTVRWALRLGLPVWCPPACVKGNLEGMQAFLGAGKARRLNDPNGLISG